MRDRSNAGTPDDEFGAPPDVFAPRTPEQELERFKRAYRSAKAQVDPLMLGIRNARKRIAQGNTEAALVALDDAIAESIKAAVDS